MIGEQLKEIAEREPLSAELLERDLEIEEMNLEAAEKHFQAYSDKQSGKKGTFCITPVVVTEDGAFFCDSFGFTKLLEEFDVREGV